jgi:NAD kinase
MEQIAIFGGSFNPPGAHHKVIVDELLKHYSKVIVVPCGPRPDKQTTNDISPFHRAVMVDKTFRGMDVEIDLRDLENSVFTRTIDMAERYRKNGVEVCIVIGSDLAIGGARGESQIQKSWKRGQEIWRDLNFAVVNADPDFQEKDLPPQGRLINVFELSGRSTDIRRAIFDRNPSFRDMVVPEVANYIEQHDLYRGLTPLRVSYLSLKPTTAVWPLVDKKNEKALKIFESLQLPGIIDSPQAILVIGGDGMMLREIKKHWRLRLPFIGINAGHRGFLLNDWDAGSWKKILEEKKLFKLFQLPMIHVAFHTASGRAGEVLCFNDVWVERATPQAAWLSIEVNGKTRVNRLIADGALVASAAGSTAYARAMGASPLPANTENFVLVGSNIMEPRFKEIPLSLDSTVKISTLDLGKRPVRGYADGDPLANGESLKFIVVRQSRIASVELGFFPEHDLAEKISRLQFS